MNKYLKNPTFLLLGLHFLFPAVYAEGPHRRSSYYLGLFGPQVYETDEGAFIYGSRGESLLMDCHAGMLQRSYNRANIPGNLILNHGHDPIGVGRLNQYLPHIRRGFIESLACGCGGSDGETWSALRPNNSVVATNPGYSSSSYWADLPDGTSGPVWEFWRLDQSGQEVSVVDPSEAKGIYRNGRFVKNLARPERNLPPGTFLNTPDGLVEGTRKPPSARQKNRCPEICTPEMTTKHSYNSRRLPLPKMPGLDPQLAAAGIGVAEGMAQEWTLNRMRESALENGGFDTADAISRLQEARALPSSWMQNVINKIMGHNPSDPNRPRLCTGDAF